MFVSAFKSTSLDQGPDLTLNYDLNSKP